MGIIVSSVWTSRTSFTVHLIAGGTLRATLPLTQYVLARQFSGSRAFQVCCVSPYVSYADLQAVQVVQSSLHRWQSGWPLTCPWLCAFESVGVNAVSAFPENSLSVRYWSWMRFTLNHGAFASPAQVLRVRFIVEEMSPPSFVLHSGRLDPLAWLLLRRCGFIAVSTVLVPCVAASTG